MKTYPTTDAAAAVRLALGAAALAAALMLERCIPVNTGSEPQYAPYQAAPPVAPAPRPFCRSFPPPAAGRTALCEDFATVPEGTLPPFWQGGEALVVRGQPGRRELAPFERRDLHRVIATGFRAEGDYRFDAAVRLGTRDGNERHYRFHLGGVSVDLRTNFAFPSRVTMNQSQSGDIPDLTGRLAHLSLRREGAVHRLLVDGRPVLLARYEQRAPVDGVTVEAEGTREFALVGLRLEGDASPEPAAAPPPPAQAAAAPPAPAPAPPAPAAEPLSLASVRDGLCAHMSDLSVRCRTWQGAALPLEGELAGLGAASALVGRDESLCATDGQGRHRCWGRMPTGTDFSEPPYVLEGRGGRLVPPAMGINGFGAMPLVVSAEGEVRGTVLAGSGDRPGGPIPFSGPAAQADQNAWTTCARLRDGRVECFGIGARPRRPGSAPPGPVRVAGIEGATDIRLGSGLGCALLADGRVRCWGLCTHGESRDGDDPGTPACRQRRGSATPSFPVRLAGPARTLGDTCAVLGDGSVQCWGADARGRPGPPRPVPGLGNVRSLSGDCAVGDGGAVRCWTYYPLALRPPIAF